MKRNLRNREAARRSLAQRLRREQARRAAYASRFSRQQARRSRKIDRAINQDRMELAAQRFKDVVAYTREGVSAASIAEVLGLSQRAVCRLRAKARRLGMLPGWKELRDRW